MKTIKKTIVIHAPNQKVWTVLTDPKYNAQWYAMFGAGAKPQSNWEIGHKILFSDDSGGGMAAVVTDNVTNKMLALEYTGLVKNGKEDSQSDEAKKYIGGKEIYVLSEKHESTQLDIASDMDEELFDAMNNVWQQAIEKIKELAEK